MDYLILFILLDVSVINKIIYKVLYIHKIIKLELCMIFNKD